MLATPPSLSQVRTFEQNEIWDKYREGEIREGEIFEVTPNNQPMLGVMGTFAKGEHFSHTWAKGLDISSDSKIKAFAAIERLINDGWKAFGMTGTTNIAQCIYCDRRKAVAADMGPCICRLGYEPPHNEYEEA